jgi:DNA-binding MarR family transcriptional regulator
MNEFLVRFFATTLDEEDLRDFLEARGIHDVSITRRDAELRRLQRPDPSITHSPGGRRSVEADASPSHRAATGPGRERAGREEMRRAILSVAETGEAFGAPEIVEQFPAFKQSDVSQQLSRLTKSGALERIEFGLYVRAGSPPPCSDVVDAIRARRSMTRTRPADQQLLDFLTTPRELDEVRRHLDVSPQRAGQKLKRLVSSGLVVRHKGASSSLFGRSLEEIHAEEARRSVALPRKARAVLEVLPEEGPIRQSTLAGKVGGADRAVRAAIDALLAATLVETRRVGGTQMIRLTNRGREHSARATARPLAPEDLTSIIGTTRVEVLIAIDILGPLTSRQLGYVLKGKNPTRKLSRIPQILAGMRAKGLISYDQEPRGQEQRPQVIGPAGEEVIEWIRRLVPYPTRAGLRQSMKDGRTAAAARARGAPGSDGEPKGISPR